LLQELTEDPNPLAQGITMILIHVRLSGSLYYIRYSFHYFLSEQKVKLASINLTRKPHLNLYFLKTSAQHIEATSWKPVISNGAWPNVSNRRQYTVGSALCKSPFPHCILSSIFHQCH